MSAPARVPVRSGPIALHAERWGHAGPVVVLGHGFGGSARNFRPQARVLSVHHQVLLFDARGHARSDAPEAPAAYRPECFVADLDAVLDASGAERAIVGGLSMGAGVALRFAIEHPDRGSGLILSAFPRAVDEPAHAPWALGFARAIEERGLEAAGEEVIWGRFDPRTADLIKRGFVEHRPHALVNVLRELIAVQPPPAAMPELAEIRVPALILVGSTDLPSLAPCRALAQRIPRATLVEIPGAGHIVNLSHPAEYNRAVADFLGTVAES